MIQRAKRRLRVRTLRDGRTQFREDGVLVAEHRPPAVVAIEGGPMMELFGCGHEAWSEPLPPGRDGSVAWGTSYMRPAATAGDADGQERRDGTQA